MLHLLSHSVFLNKHHVTAVRFPPFKIPNHYLFSPSPNPKKGGLRYHARSHLFSHCCHYVPVVCMHMYFCYTVLQLCDVFLNDLTKMLWLKDLERVLSAQHYFHIFVFSVVIWLFRVWPTSYFVTSHSCIANYIWNQNNCNTKYTEKLGCPLEWIWSLFFG